jgi:hypothetical protein
LCRLHLLAKLLLLLQLLPPLQLFLLPKGCQCCVELVPKQRAAHSCHLCAYLMGSPRHKLQGAFISLRPPLPGCAACQGNLCHLQSMGHTKHSAYCVHRKLDKRPGVMLVHPGVTQNSAQAMLLVDAPLELHALSAVSAG